MNTQTNGPESDSAADDSAVVLLERVRESLTSVSLPLDLEGATEARTAVTGSLAQLDDYILPRYRSLDAPLLAVVGGSTGAGKSTLVNALIGHPVTRTGAIRPTTRQPILLHHPQDVRWFADQRVLPSLSRVTGAGPGTVTGAGPATATTGKGQDGAAVTSLLMIADDAVPQGLALLDSPDVDSIADENRRLAGQLLAAADLWLFVTTSNRYADAVPWKLLVEAAARDILVGVVLDRVPEGAEAEVSADLRGLLEREGLGTAPLFVVPEVPLESTEAGPGMLPAATVAPIRDWLEKIAADAAGRAAIARRTLAGAVQSLGRRLTDIAQAADNQQKAADNLAAMARSAYDDAAARILDATKDGTLLRGEVLARWQDFVGTGEFFRSLESGIGRLRDRIGAFLTGKPTPAVSVENAIESGLQAVIVAETARAAEEADQRWRADHAGRQLLGTEDLSALSPGFAERSAEQIRAWQGDLMELIRSEGADRRFTARMISFGVNGLGVTLMIVVFASTAGLTGLELGVAGGTAVLGQKLLEAVFGEDAVRRLAKTARENLADRCRRLLTEEEARFLSRLDVLSTQVPSATLRTQAAQLSALSEQRA